MSSVNSFRISSGLTCCLKSLPRRKKEQAVKQMYPLQKVERSKRNRNLMQRNRILSEVRIKLLNSQWLIFLNNKLRVMTHSQIHWLLCIPICKILFQLCNIKRKWWISSKKINWDLRLFRKKIKTKLKLTLPNMFLLLCWQMPNIWPVYRLYGIVCINMWTKKSEINKICLLNHSQKWKWIVI